ncbi:MAG: hypothetical protein R3A79_09735 [Nannocystaceae bacterium]
MIDYDVLCQAIADWKAGRAPSTVVTHDARPPSPPAPPRRVEEIHDVEDEFDELEEAEELDEVVQEEPEEHTVIYQLPIEPLDEDDL